MALQETTVSINLGQGIDQGSNDYVGDPQTFLDLKNMVYNKMKETDKRPGTSKLPTTVMSSFPSPLTIGTSPIASGLTTHRNELLLQNKGVLYTYLENESKWKFVGHQYPLSVDVETAASLQQSCYWPNMGKIGNISIYAFVEVDESSSSQGATLNLRYSVLDESTGSYLISNQIVQTASPSTVFSGQIAYPQVITFASAAYIVWNFTQSSSPTASDIRICSVNLTTGALGSITTLKSDAQIVSSNVSNPNVANAGGTDWVYTNKVGVGERAFFVYYTQAGNGVVFSIKNDGTVDATMGSLTIATPRRGFGIHYNVSLDRLFIGYQGTALLRTFAKVASFTTSAITSVTDIQLANNTESIHVITFCDDPVNSSQIYAIWDVADQDKVNNTFLYPYTLNYAICSSSAVISSVVPWGRSIIIAAKPISDTLRKTVYVPVSQRSALQDTAFLADLKRGKAENQMFTQAKWQYGTNFSNTSSYIPSMINLGNDQYTFLSMRQARINDLTFTNSPLSDLQSSFIVDIPRNTIDLSPEFTATSAFLNEGTHFSGGYLGYYDGAQFCEHSFFLNPEYLEALQSATNDRVNITVTTPGSPGVGEVFTVGFPGAAGMLAGPTYYWEFSTTVGYYVWYTIAGVGSDPMVGGSTGIPVVLTGSESSYEVAKKTTAAINGVAAIQAIASFLGGFPAANGFQIMTVTLTYLGGVTPPNSTNYQVAATNGAIPAGSYQYCAVWSWVDNNGLVMRSGASTPITFTSTATQPATLTLYVPPITNRSVADCKVEIYRTLIGPGDTFFRIYSAQASPSWNTSGTTISFLDTIADSGGGPFTGLASQQELYTSGGVLDNYQIPAFTNLSTYKGRLVASGMNESEVFYSKSGVVGQPIEFAAELFIATEQDGQQVTAHGDLDDKLVIFKEKKTIYYAGDGANDLGQNSTFSQPVRVASDVGCTNQASVEILPSGLMFKSVMGIQHLDRGTNMTYVGVQVKDYNSFSLSKALVLRDDDVVRQIRFNLQDTALTLVYDYIMGKWTVFTNYLGTDATLWQGQYSRVDYDGLVWVEDKSTFKDAGVSYNQVIETQWLKVKNVQDFQRVWLLGILGTLKTAHTLNFKVYYDYDESNFDQYNFDSSNISGTLPGDLVYDPQVNLERQKCMSIKVLMTVIPSGTNTEECVTLVDLAFICGVKQGLNKIRAGKSV